jgi:hypothetical protein
LCGCTTVGTLGIVSKSSIEAPTMLREGRPFTVVGPAQSESCRYILFGVFPTGSGDMQTATDLALRSVGGGDALLNVTTETSLYSFIPIYNVFAESCIVVKGTAIKFESAPPKGG